MFLQVFSKNVELNGETIFSGISADSANSQILHNMIQEHCNSLRDDIIDSISEGKCVHTSGHAYILSIHLSTPMHVFLKNVSWN